MGRSARGVSGIKLKDDDKVAAMVATDDDDHRSLLTVTEHGFGKRTDLDEYRTQSRYGKGLIDIKADDRNGRVSTAKPSPTRTIWSSCPNRARSAHPRRRRVPGRSEHKGCDDYGTRRG